MMKNLGGGFGSACDAVVVWSWVLWGGQVAR